MCLPLIAYICNRFRNILTVCYIIDKIYSIQSMCSGYWYSEVVFCMYGRNTSFWDFCFSRRGRQSSQPATGGGTGQAPTPHNHIFLLLIFYGNYNLGAQFMYYFRVPMFHYMKIMVVVFTRGYCWCVMLWVRRVGGSLWAGGSTWCRSHRASGNWTDRFYHLYVYLL